MEFDQSTEMFKLTAPERALLGFQLDEFAIPLAGLGRLTAAIHETQGYLDAINLGTEQSGPIQGEVVALKINANALLDDMLDVIATHAGPTEEDFDQLLRST